MHWIAELRLLARETALVPAAALLAALSAFAVWGGLDWLEARERVAQETRAEHKRDLAWVAEGFAALARGERVRLDPSNPMNAVGRVRPVVVEPSPALLWSATGTRELHPPAWAATDRRVGELPPDEPRSPSLLANGRFDLDFLVTLLLPWFAILLAHRLASGERESGRWAMLTGHARRPWLVISRRAALGAAVLAASATCVVALTLLARGRATGDALAALAAWSGVVLLVLVFWTALALAVGALGRSSTFNLGVLAFAWVLLCWAIPVATAELAVAVHPTEDRTAIARRARSESGALWQRRGEIARQTFASHGFDPAEIESALADKTRAGDIERLAFSLEFPRQLGSHSAELDAQRERRHQLEALAVFASPAFAAHAALLDIAGSAPRHRRALEDQAQLEFEHWKLALIRRVVARDALEATEYDALSELATAQAVELPPARSPWLALGAWAVAALLGAWFFIAGSAPDHLLRRT